MVFEIDIQVTRDPIHRDFLREAYFTAQTRSIDPSTQTGAIIVSPDLKEILSYGFNHFREGVTPTEEQLKDWNWKINNIVHAEVDSIEKAKKSLNDCIMYMPWIPCIPCAEKVLNSGIKTFISHKEVIDMNPERWQENTRKAVEYLKEEGMKMLMYSGEIGGIAVRFDGKIWKP